MLLTQLRCNLRIGHAAFIGRLHPKFNFSIVASVVPQKNLRYLHIFKERSRLLRNYPRQCQLQPPSAGLSGFSNTDAPGKKLPVLEEAASDPTFESFRPGSFTPDGMVENSKKILDSEHWPHIQMLHLKMTEALQASNVLESSRYFDEMRMFMKEKMGITSEESVRECSIFWLTDMTMGNPTFLLPLITCATRYLIVKYGTDSARLNVQNMNMNYTSHILPIIVFSLMIHSPAAIPTYWACRNLIYMGHIAAQQIPALRQYFKTNELKTNEVTWPTKKDLFMSDIKKSWANKKTILSSIKLNELRFASVVKGKKIKNLTHDSTIPPKIIYL